VRSATVTFLFTDIEGSTRLWQQDEQAMRAAMARHDEVLHAAVADHGGDVFSTMGDGLAAAFGSPSAAVAAAVMAQRELALEQWPTALPIRVRMGLHTGEAEERGGDYFGTAVNRAARLMAVGNGGQVLCSGATAGLVDAEVRLVDLGEHRLRDLDRAVHVFQVGEERFAPLRSLDAFPGNLPLQLSSFVGRAREVGQIAGALSECRVVTLTGVGGVGKTRLALQVAAEVLPRFREGAWLVELATVRDADGVGDAVAGAFGLAARAGTPIEESLVDFLRTKQLLLVLDNCEHLLDGVAHIVDTLGGTCPHVVVLATSREGLAIDGERILAVPSFGAPPHGADLASVAGNDAVRLFLARARQADATFDLTGSNASAVAEVCRRLDGVPLAIELAAARVTSMTPAELAAGLDRRFDMFEGGRRRAVQRHQTLRATVDWSYELCNEVEQRLLARLAVFAGGCTRDAVEAVCGTPPVEARHVVAALTGLVSKSLVVADRGDARTRYRLLETIREYGEERLDGHGETLELRRRHAAHYTALLEGLVDQGGFPASDDALVVFAAEQENSGRAMRWAIDTGDTDTAMRLLSSAPRSGGEFTWAAEPVLIMPGAPDHPAYLRGLAAGAFAAAYRGDLAMTERYCDLIADAQRERDTEPSGTDAEFDVAIARGMVLYSRGAFFEAAAQMEGALPHARGRAGSGELAWWLAGVGALYAEAEDDERALPLATEAVTVARQSGARWSLSHSLTALANALAEREPDRAAVMLQESLDLAVEHTRLAQLPQAVLAAGRLRDRKIVLDCARRAIPFLHWHHDLPMLGGVLTITAWAIAAPDPTAAATIQGAARAILLRSAASAGEPREVPPASTGSRRPNIIQELRQDTTRDLRAVLDDEQVRELWGEGSAMDVDAAVAFALDVITRF
jgi:predicted ATPase/class 3 adenylate cyclase